MDFSVLLQDLRDVAEKYKGKTTEPQVATNAYVDMFTKILKKALKVTEDYEDQITVLWVVLNQLASIYKDLSPGQARDQLCKFVFGMCARTVLNIQWSNLDEDSKAKKSFCVTVQNVHEVMSQQGFHKFQVIMDLMESHWTHPTLSMVMSGDDEEENKEQCLEYIQKQDPEVLKLRIEIMMKESCEEFALNLCHWSLRHPALHNDLKIKEHQIYILYKQGEYSRMQEVCETIVCHDGIKVMSHLAKPGNNNQELCIRLAQVFLIQDWVQTERTCCTQELLKLWIHHQYLADKDEERFLDSIWTVAKVCRDTQQIGVLIDGVRKECGDLFIQLYTDLCKYAINIDKGNIEKEQQAGNLDEVKRRKLCMSKTCVRMAFMLKEYDFHIARVCGLTAFTLDPTTENLNLVNKLYWTIKNTSAVSRNSKIDIASIYEVERLLGQMRPESLNPDYSWKQLIPVCKKFKQDCDAEELGRKPVKQEAVVDKKPAVTPTATISSANFMAEQAHQPKHKHSPKDIKIDHLKKMLNEKNVSREQMEKILAEQFPRNASDLKDAPALDMQQLDKTIDALKKSIYMETSFRESLEKNLSPLATKNKSQTHPVQSAVNNVQGMTPSQGKLLHQQLTAGERQHQQSQHLSQQSLQSSHQPSTSSYPHATYHQQPRQSSPMSPPAAHSHHRRLSSPTGKGSFLTETVHPPPAHSTMRRLSSPTGNTPTSGIQAQSGQPRQLGKPAVLGHSKPKVQGGQSGDVKLTKYSKTVSDLLSSKIKEEMGYNQKQGTPQSTFNVLRPPGSANQECAKIAQQIAEMHEKQRGKERLEKARAQGKYDAAKALLMAKSDPSQIANLLSLTFQGNKEKNSAKRLKSPVQEQSPSQNTKLPAALAKGTSSSSNTNNPTTSQAPAAQGSQQKFFVTTKKDMLRLKPDEHGNVNIGDSQYSIKPLISIPKSELLKNLKNVIKSTDGSTQLVYTSSHGTSTSFSPATISSSTLSSQYADQNVQFQTPVPAQSVPLAVQEITLPSSTTSFTGNQQQHKQLESVRQFSNQPDFLTGMVVPTPPLAQTQGTTSAVEVGPMLQNLDTLASASLSLLDTTNHVPASSQVFNFPASQGLQVQAQQAALLSPLVNTRPILPAVPGIQVGQPVSAQSVAVTPLYTSAQPILGNQLTTTIAAFQNPVTLAIEQPVQQIIAVHDTGSVSLNLQSPQQQPQVLQVQPQQLRATAMTLNNYGQVRITQIPVPVQQSPVHVQQSGYNQVTHTTLAAPAMKLAPKQPGFISPPELSPAVVQQILTSLKHSNAGRNIRSNSTGTLNPSQPKPVLPKTSSANPKANVPHVADAVKQIMMKTSDPSLKQSVIEATKKIVELRKQHGHQPEGSAVGKPLQRSISVDSKGHRQMADEKQIAEGLIQKLVAADGDKKVASKQSTSALSALNLAKFIEGNPTGESLSPVPDLPDLGAKEFQIDAILGLEGDQSTASQVAGTATSNQPLPSTSEQKKKSQPGKGQSTYLNANKLGQEREKSSSGSNSSGGASGKQQETVELLRCPQCVCYFPTKQSVMLHLKNNQCLGQGRDDESMPCQHCRKTFRNKRNLLKHQEHHCKSLYNKAITEKVSQSKVNQQEEREERFTVVKCPNCSLFFRNKDNMMLHRSISKCDVQPPIESNGLQCGICERAFKNVNEIKEHVKNGCVSKEFNYRKPQVYNAKDFEFTVLYLCKQCKASTSNEKTAYNHIKACPMCGPDSKPLIMYKCCMCGEVFDNKDITVRHVSKQCPKRRLVDNQRHVQEMYDKQLLKQQNQSSWQQRVSPAAQAQSGPSHLSPTTESVESTQRKAEIPLNHPLPAQIPTNQPTSTKQKSVARKVDTMNPKPLNCTSPEAASRHVIQPGMATPTSDVALNSHTSAIVTALHTNLRATEQPEVAGPKTEKSTTLAIPAQVKKVEPDSHDDMVRLPEKQPGNQYPQQAAQEPAALRQIDERTVKTNVPADTTKAQSKLSPDKEMLKARNEQRIHAEKLYMQEFIEIEKRKAQQLKSGKSKLAALVAEKREDKELERMRRKASQDLEEDEKRFKKERLKAAQERKIITNMFKDTDDSEYDSDNKKSDDDKNKNVNKILGKFVSINLEEKIKQDVKIIEDIKKRQREEEKRQKRAAVKETKQIRAEFHNKVQKSSDGKVKEKNPYIRKDSETKREVKEPEEGKRRGRSKKTETISDKKENKSKPTNAESFPVRNKVAGRKRMTAKHLVRSPQDMRRMRGLRAKRLIKKRRFFDEIDAPESAPVPREQLRNKAVKTLNRTVTKNDRPALKTKKDASVPEDMESSPSEQTSFDYAKFCHLCPYQAPPKMNAFKLYITQHYVYRHNLGFRSDRHRFRCSFCKVDVPSSHMMKIKEHIFMYHKEPLMMNVKLGKYDDLFDTYPVPRRSGGNSPRFSPRKPVKRLQEKQQRHKRALELRKECAENLKKIALQKKDSVIELDEDTEDLENVEALSPKLGYTNDHQEKVSSAAVYIVKPLGNELRDQELNSSDKERIYVEKEADSSTRRLAKRLTRNQVRTINTRNSARRQSPIQEDMSESDNTIDIQIHARSRSSSLSSSISAFSSTCKQKHTKPASAESARRSNRPSTVITTRSGRKIVMMESDSSYEAEPSSDESTVESPDEKQSVRRKSSRIRRLSDKMKTLGNEEDAKSESESSEDEIITPRVTRSRKSLDNALNNGAKVESKGSGKSGSKFKEPKDDMGDKGRRSKKQQARRTLESHYDSDTESNTVASDSSSVSVQPRILTRSSSKLDTNEKHRTKSPVSAKTVLIGPDEDVSEQESSTNNQKICHESGKTVLVDSADESGQTESLTLSEPVSANVCDPATTASKTTVDKESLVQDANLTKQKAVPQVVMDEEEFAFLKDGTSQELTEEKSEPLNDSIKSTCSVSSDIHRSDGTAFDSEFIKFAENKAAVCTELEGEQSSLMSDASEVITESKKLAELENQELLTSPTKFNAAFENFARSNLPKCPEQKHDSIDPKGFSDAFQSFASGEHDKTLSLKKSSSLNKFALVNVKRLSTDSLQNKKDNVATIADQYNLPRCSISIKRLSVEEIELQKSPKSARKIIKKPESPDVVIIEDSDTETDEVCQSKNIKRPIRYVRSGRQTSKTNKKIMQDDDVVLVAELEDHVAISNIMEEAILEIEKAESPENCVEIIGNVSGEGDILAVDEEKSVDSSNVIILIDESSNSTDGDVKVETGKSSATVSSSQHQSGVPSETRKHFDIKAITGNASSETLSDTALEACLINTIEGDKKDSVSGKSSTACVKKSEPSLPAIGTGKENGLSKDLDKSDDGPQFVFVEEDVADIPDLDDIEEITLDNKREADLMSVATESVTLVKGALEDENTVQEGNSIVREQETVSVNKVEKDDHKEISRSTNSSFQKSAEQSEVCEKADNENHRVVEMDSEMNVDKGSEEIVALENGESSSSKVQHQLEKNEDKSKQGLHEGKSMDDTDQLEVVLAKVHEPVLEKSTVQIEHVMDNGENAQHVGDAETAQGCEVEEMGLASDKSEKLENQQELSNAPSLMKKDETVTCESEILLEQGNENTDDFSITQTSSDQSAEPYTIHMEMEEEKYIKPSIETANNSKLHDVNVDIVEKDTEVTMTMVGVSASLAALQSYSDDSDIESIDIASSENLTKEPRTPLKATSVTEDRMKDSPSKNSDILTDDDDIKLINIHGSSVDERKSEEQTILPTIDEKDGNLSSSNLSTTSKENGKKEPLGKSTDLPMEDVIPQDLAQLETKKEDDTQQAISLPATDAEELDQNPKTIPIDNDDDVLQQAKTECKINPISIEKNANIPPVLLIDNKREYLENKHLNADQKSDEPMDESDMPEGKSKLIAEEESSLTEATKNQEDNSTDKLVEHKECSGTSTKTSAEVRYIEIDKIKSIPKSSNVDANEDDAHANDNIVTESKENEIIDNLMTNEVSMETIMAESSVCGSPSKATGEGPSKSTIAVEHTVENPETDVANGSKTSESDSECFGTNIANEIPIVLEDAEVSSTQEVVTTYKSVSAGTLHGQDEFSLSADKLVCTEANVSQAIELLPADHSMLHSEQNALSLEPTPVLVVSDDHTEVVGQLSRDTEKNTVNDEHCIDTVSDEVKQQQQLPTTIGNMTSTAQDDGANLKPTVDSIADQQFEDQNQTKYNINTEASATEQRKFNAPQGVLEIRDIEGNSKDKNKASNTESIDIHLDSTSTVNIESEGESHTFSDHFIESNATNMNMLNQDDIETNIGKKDPGAPKRFSELINTKNESIHIETFTTSYESESELSLISESGFLESEKESGEQASNAVTEMDIPDREPGVAVSSKSEDIFRTEYEADNAVSTGIDQIEDPVSGKDDTNLESSVRTSVIEEETGSCELISFKNSNVFGNFSDVISMPDSKQQNVETADLTQTSNLMDDIEHPLSEINNKLTEETSSQKSSAEEASSLKQKTAAFTHNTELELQEISLNNEEVQLPTQNTALTTRNEAEAEEELADWVVMDEYKDGDSKENEAVPDTAGIATNTVSTEECIKHEEPLSKAVPQCKPVQQTIEPLATEEAMVKGEICDDQGVVAEQIQLVSSKGNDEIVPVESTGAFFHTEESAEIVKEKIEVLESEVFDQVGNDKEDHDVTSFEDKDYTNELIQIADLSSQSDSLVRDSIVETDENKTQIRLEKEKLIAECTDVIRSARIKQQKGRASSQRTDHSSQVFSKRLEENVQKKESIGQQHQNFPTGPVSKNNLNESPQKTIRIIKRTIKTNPKNPGHKDKNQQVAWQSVKTTGPEIINVANLCKTTNEGSTEQILQTAQNRTIKQPTKLKNLDIEEAKRMERKGSLTDDSISPEVQHENETDEEFKRRIKAVRSARRRSSVKAYESDFDLSDNSNNSFQPIRTESTARTEFNLDNFDTASLYSNSSSGSNKHEGRAALNARCARDFGREEMVHIVQLVPVSGAANARPQNPTSSGRPSPMPACLVKSVPMSTAVSIAGRITPPAVKKHKQSPESKNQDSKRRKPVIGTVTEINSKQTELTTKVISHSRSPVTVSSSLSDSPQKTTISAMAAKLANRSNSITSTQNSFSVMKKYQPPMMSVSVSKKTFDVTSQMLNEEQDRLKKSMSPTKTPTKSYTGRANKAPVVPPDNKQASDQNDQESDTEEGTEEEQREVEITKAKSLWALHKDNKPFSWDSSPSRDVKPRHSSTVEENLDEKETSGQSSTDEADSVCFKAALDGTSRVENIDSQENIPGNHSTEQKSSKSKSSNKGSKDPESQTSKTSETKTKLSGTKTALDGKANKTLASVSSKTLLDHPANESKTEVKSIKAHGTRSSASEQKALETLDTPKNNKSVAKVNKEKRSEVEVDKGKAKMRTRSRSIDQTEHTNIGDMAKRDALISKKAKRTSDRNNSDTMIRENVNNKEKASTPGDIRGRRSLCGASAKDKIVPEDSNTVEKSHKGSKDNADSSLYNLHANTRSQKAISETKNGVNVRARSSSKDSISDTKTRSRSLSVDKPAETRSRHSSKESVKSVQSKTPMNKTKHSQETDNRTLRRSSRDLTSESSVHSGQKRKSSEPLQSEGNKRKSSGDGISILKPAKSKGGTDKDKLAPTLKQQRPMTRHNSASTLEKVENVCENVDDVAEFEEDSKLYSNTKLSVIEEVKRRVQKRNSLRDVYTKHDGAHVNTREGRGKGVPVNLRDTRKMTHNDDKSEKTTAEPKIQTNVHAEPVEHIDKMDQSALNSETLNKRQKLDGTPNSPDKSDSEEKTKDDSMNTSERSTARNVSPYRQLIHRGKVIQIGKGHVSEFDIQNRTSPSRNKNSPTASRAVIADEKMEENHMDVCEIPNTRQMRKRASSVKQESDPKVTRQSSSSEEKSPGPILRVKKSQTLATNVNVKKPSIFTRKRTIDNYINDTLNQIRKTGSPEKNWRLQKNVKKSFNVEFKKSGR